MVGVVVTSNYGCGSCQNRNVMEHDLKDATTRCNGLCILQIFIHRQCCILSIRWSIVSCFWLFVVVVVVLSLYLYCIYFALTHQLFPSFFSGMIQLITHRRENIQEGGLGGGLHWKRRR